MRTAARGRHYSPNFNLQQSARPSVHAPQPTTAHFNHAQKTLSPRALEKQALRDDSFRDRLLTQLGSSAVAGPAAGASDLTAIPQAPDDLVVPPAAALPGASHAGTTAPLRPRPLPKHRRSFIEKVLARQQNKERSGPLAASNTLRVLSPINYIPRPTPVHFSHPDRRDTTTDPTARDSRTLLSLPEQRRSRQNSPNTPTFQESFAPDPEGSHQTSIGLPSNHRVSAHSFDTRRRSMSQEKPLPADPPLSKQHTRENTLERELSANLQSKLASNYGLSEADQPSQPPRRVSSQKSLSHVRSLASLRSASYARNQSEGGLPVPQSPALLSPKQQTPIQPSFPQSPSPLRDVESGHDADPEAPAFDEEPPWGPSHPCYPHLNPHVPLHSPAYNATRIIRIRRDWMILGDLAPTYSNIYPEILDPLLPEQEFRYIIDHINNALIRAFDPFAAANWLDGILGFLTGWFWEDLRSTGIKGEVKKLEEWIENWNRTVGAGDGVRIIPLRRTGYMNIDIQIPDPQVRVIGDSRERTPDDAGGSATPRPTGSVPRA